MQLNRPFEISSRLMAAVRIGGAWVNIEYDGETIDGRTRYHWVIDLPNGTEHEGRDLKSGVGAGGIREGMASLLNFLGTAAESWRYAGEKGENADLFPKDVVEWAAQNSDEISMVEIEIEENQECVIE